MDLDLNGRVAVVTGASKGIGLAVARTLLEEGALVVAASRSRSEELDALGDNLLHVPANLMGPGAPAKVIAHAIDEFGGLDILVNNAGGPPPDREGVMTTVAPEMMQLTTGRLAEPQEIADTVAFLLSPHAASTTGTEVVVDSGMIKT